MTNKIWANRWHSFTLGVVLLSPCLPALGQSDVDATAIAMMDSDQDSRRTAFYALLGQFRNPQGSIRLSTERLLAAYPQQREKIAVALIAALEKEVAHRKLTEQRGESLTETFSDYWSDLMAVVAMLKDPRSVKGLVGGVDTGGIAVNGLADICPSSIDALVETGRAPNPMFRDTQLAFRAGAISAIGACLQRAELVRANPEVQVKARGALLTALDDEDWRVRWSATEAAFPFRGEAEFRDKLTRIAGLDTYVSPLPRVEPGKTSFVVRDAARALLDGEEASLFYVVRTGEGRECRVSSGSPGVSRTALMGPFATLQDAQHGMCTHLDSSGKDQFACGTATPASACSK